MHEIDAQHLSAGSSDESRGKAHLAYGESLFPNSFQPSELRPGRYPVEQVAWPDSRHLEITVVVSMLSALMVLCWLVLRVVFS